MQAPCPDDPRVRQAFERIADRRVEISEALESSLRRPDAETATHKQEQEERKDIIQEDEALPDELDDSDMEGDAMMEEDDKDTQTDVN